MGQVSSSSAENMGETQKRPVGNFGDKYFTDKQKVLLRRTWAILLVDMQAKGVRVFARVFELAPEAKKLFPFKDVAGDELLRHPTFMGHGMRFMKAVGGAVDHLDALDVILMPNLVQLGRQHASFPGFSTDYLNVFVDAMDYVWRKELGKQYNRDTREAWQKIFRLIMSKLSEGYGEARCAINWQQKQEHVNNPAQTPVIEAHRQASEGSEGRKNTALSLEEEQMAQKQGNVRDQKTVVNGEGPTLKQQTEHASGRTGFTG